MTRKQTYLVIVVAAALLLGGSGVAIARVLLNGDSTHARAAPCAPSDPQSRGASLSSTPSGTVKLPRLSRVIVVVMENKECSDVIGNQDAPYLNALAKRGALATSWYAITHPSLPNYLALIGGSTFGIDSDCTDCHVGGANLVDQLEAAKIPWRAYMEGMPSPCFKGAFAGSYAKKHDPFMYFDDVAGDPSRCRKVVPLTQLSRDLQAGTLPTFAWISPDLCHDMHDCSVRTGDAFLAGLVPRLLRALGPNGLLVVTWDEGRSDRGCCGKAGGGNVATILAGSAARAGARSAAPSTHYSLLRTLEDAWGLRRLGGAAHARPMTALLVPG